MEFLDLSGLTKYDSLIKSWVKRLVDRLKSVSIEKVAELPPAESAKTNVIYFVPSANTSAKNTYDEYILIDGKFEFIGTTEVDLTDYATEAWVTDNFRKKGVNIPAAEVTPDDTHRFVTDSEKSDWNNKANAQHIHDTRYTLYKHKLFSNQTTLPDGRAWIRILQNLSTQNSAEPAIVQLTTGYNNTQPNVITLLISQIYQYPQIAVLSKNNPNSYIKSFRIVYPQGNSTVMPTFFDIECDFYIDSAGNKTSNAIAVKVISLNAASYVPGGWNPVDAAVLTEAGEVPDDYLVYSIPNVPYAGSMSENYIANGKFVKIGGTNKQALLANGDVLDIDTKLDVDGSNGTATGLSNVIRRLHVGDTDVKDTTDIITANVVDNSAKNPYTKRPAIYVWNYIYNKLKSIHSPEHFGFYRISGRSYTFNAGTWYRLGVGTPGLLVFYASEDSANAGAASDATFYSLDGGYGLDTFAWGTLQYGIGCTSTQPVIQFSEQKTFYIVYYSPYPGASAFNIAANSDPVLYSKPVSGNITINYSQQDADAVADIETVKEDMETVKTDIEELKKKSNLRGRVTVSDCTGGSCSAAAFMSSGNAMYEVFTENSGTSAATFLHVSLYGTGTLKANSEIATGSYSLVNSKLIIDGKGLTMSGSMTITGTSTTKTFSYNFIKLISAQVQVAIQNLEVNELMLQIM